MLVLLRCQLIGRRLAGREIAILTSQVAGGGQCTNTVRMLTPSRLQTPADELLSRQLDHAGGVVIHHFPAVKARNSGAAS